MIKLWIDDIRPAPDETYVHLHSVNEAKHFIEQNELPYGSAQCYLNSISAASMFAEDQNDALVELHEAQIDLRAHTIELIDIDHDAGDFASDGGDYINFLKWLAEYKPQQGIFNVHIHSMNPVGAQNMRYIIQDNGWNEV